MGKFITGDKPMLTVMLQCRTPEVAIGRIRNALHLGADAFGLQVESLLLEHQTPEVFLQIFGEMNGRPAYVTNYRFSCNKGKSDEELAQGLLTLADCGAALCDVQGDLFAPHPLQMTEDPEAIHKQMELIDALHAKERLADVLKAQLEQGCPVDVAIDCLGGEDLGKCLHYLRHGAKWIMIAALAGQLTQIDLKNIYVRNVRLIGSTLRSRAPEVKAKLLEELVEKIWPKVVSGEVKPTIYQVLPIREAEAAQDILYQSKSVGKVVLTVE